MLQQLTTECRFFKILKYIYVTPKGLKNIKKGKSFCRRDTNRETKTEVLWILLMTEVYGFNGF